MFLPPFFFFNLILRRFFFRIKSANFLACLTLTMFCIFLAASFRFFFSSSRIKRLRAFSRASSLF